ncbi:MAG: hypothetical protein H8E55_64665 [Pelagibacterales bacterium]|nr:hypothetical protein [Pelagibacterales bacterium]
MSKVIGMDGKQPPKTKINLKADDLKDVVCEECGSKYFRQVQSFKKLSALVSPTGKEQIVPVPTFRCDDCGYINEEFRVK